MLNEIDLSRADLNLLVLFEAVLAERHVGRAADRMSLTPSAVSHGLGRLRRMLNDPLFLKTPRGVTPTARAMELAAPIAEALARVRAVLADAAPFDPATSTRRFTIAAPDAVAAVILPPLLAALRASAPGVDLSVRQLMPMAGEAAPDRAWRGAFAELEARAMDVAVIPSDACPPRFHVRRLFEEPFVLAMRRGHPFADDPTLDRYCACEHLVVSTTGDAHGFVDEALARRGRRRRVALTVPGFMFALAALPDSELVCAMPERLVRREAARFGLVAVEAPLPLERFGLNAVAPGAAMLDLGLAWLFDQLAAASSVLGERGRAQG